MKVTYLINHYPKVSHTFIRREILALEKQGVTVQRLALRGWDNPTPDEQDVAERDKTQYILRRGMLPLFGVALRLALQAPGKFAAALFLALRMSRGADRPLPYHLIYLLEACQALIWARTFGSQHIHAHFGTNSTEVAMLVSALGGPDYSFTMHGSEEFDKPQQVRLGDKIRMASFVAAITSYTRSQLSRWCEHDHWSKIHEVHCGLEPAFFSGDIAAPSGRQLINVGRFCEQKGQLLLIEACSLALQKGADFTLVLAGDGEFRGVIEALIAKLGLQGRVRITGWISSDQVKAEILASRAMVMSSFAEGLPVVLMEAMALKRPVLSTWITGIPELVRHGENGWLYPAGDVEALADAIIECMASSDSRLLKMGEAGRGAVLAGYCADREATKLVRHFKDAIHA